MLDIFRTRRQQGSRTHPFPASEPTLPLRYRGLPVLEPSKCEDGCQACIEACPTKAVQPADGDAPLRLDLGRCLFCTVCSEACPTNALSFASDYRLATRSRDDLQFKGRALELAAALDKKILRLYGRSLNLRVVSAGGCNACESDVNVLSTIVFDLSRFGIHIVASPRHADALIVTGPVTQNMQAALKEAYRATPGPKFVIAVGACAISGGPFMGHSEVNDGADSVVPVDLYIPGCPPHPFTILDGLLRLLGRRAEASQPSGRNAQP